MQNAKKRILTSKVETQESFIFLYNPTKYNAEIDSDFF